MTRSPAGLRRVPIFPRVPALLSDELHHMAAIQAKTLAGVPRDQPGVLGLVANLHPQVLRGVPCGHGHTPRHPRTGCPFMIGDVPFGQARVLLAVPRVETLVRGQMPARQRRMLLDVAVFNRGVLPDVPRTRIRFPRSLVGHDHSSSRATMSARRLLRTHEHQAVIADVDNCMSIIVLRMICRYR